MANTSTEYGYLALADISGYNAFVSGTEFDHAQEIITDLLEFLVNRLRLILNLVQICRLCVNMIPRNRNNLFLI